MQPMTRSGRPELTDVLAGDAEVDRLADGASSDAHPEVGERIGEAAPMTSAPSQLSADSAGENGRRRDRARQSSCRSFVNRACPRGVCSERVATGRALRCPFGVLAREYLPAANRLTPRIRVRSQEQRRRRSPLRFDAPPGSGTQCAHRRPDRPKCSRRADRPRLSHA